MNTILHKFISLGILLFLLSFTSVVWAQNNDVKNRNHDARVKEFFNMKKKFLKEKVNMTDDEEARFFPLYLELQKKKFDIQRSLHRQMNALKDTESTITDDMYHTVSESINNARLKESQLENDYYRRFSKIFSPEKLYKFQLAEISFNRDMLRKRGRSNEGPKSHK